MAGVEVWVEGWAAGAIAKNSVAAAGGVVEDGWVGLADLRKANLQQRAGQRLGFRHTLHQPTGGLGKPVPQHQIGSPARLLSCGLAGLPRCSPLLDRQATMRS